MPPTVSQAALRELAVSYISKLGAVGPDIRTLPGGATAAKLEFGPQYLLNSLPLATYAGNRTGTSASQGGVNDFADAQNTLEQDGKTPELVPVAAGSHLGVSGRKNNIVVEPGVRSEPSLPDGPKPAYQHSFPAQSVPKRRLAE